jgi:hypothetical protein
MGGMLMMSIRDQEYSTSLDLQWLYPFPMNKNCRASAPSLRRVLRYLGLMIIGRTAFAWDIQAVRRSKPIVERNSGEKSKQSMTISSCEQHGY